MPKREKPDRVYGLRVTRRLERLLHWTEDKRPASAGKHIGESLRTSPFRPDGEPIIFPFLALEAKSEKGSYNFSDIQIQTAFTIYTLLKLQEELRQAAGEESQWETGPLVWFLANKGEMWRVAAAYIEYEGAIQHYVKFRFHRLVFIANRQIRESPICGTVGLPLKMELFVFC